MHLEGKNVIITGGSSGIGKATAEHLSMAGANVFIVARDRGKLDRALEEIKAKGGNPGAQCGAFCADVSPYQEVEAAVAAIEEAGACPDALINSAGVVYPGLSRISRWLVSGRRWTPTTSARFTASKPSSRT